MNTSTSANIGHLLAGLSIVVALALGMSGLIYTAYSSGQEDQDKSVTKLELRMDRSAEAAHKSDLCLTAIQVDIEHIKKAVEDSKKVQERILDKLK